ncbi:patatin-like phospholipase family protein [Microbacterium sp. NEAU-LLC]|uniref:Patatin-like phospholipase family protein n=1 Tax=Microbacterium helvum TaxID=2773713 RepID=A0ABR8NQF3_9MICO|nr:patatin-like phospholipase family protein [Microbacterium helvum]MBD3941992.1 patatin-like phospholipase family protein [Microbacterium helvum]
MNNSSSLSRALVLGGGGSSGNAWVLGVVAGLYAAGLDVTTVDVMIGTSSGSTTAVQLARVDPLELYAATIAPLPASAGDRRGGSGSTRPVVNHLERTAAIIAESSDPADMRRRLGASSLELAAADPEWQPRWRHIVAGRLPDPRWPERPVQITAVDARTGDGVVFTRDSGVELVDAVAASTSSGPAYRIGDGWYVDGGYRSNAENADLATGYDRVLVLSPYGGRTRTPAEWRLDVGTQIEALRAAGSRAELIGPPAEHGELFGARGMDPTLRRPAAEVGHAQGFALVPLLADLWR